LVQVVLSRGFEMEATLYASLLDNVELRPRLKHWN